VPNFHYLPTLSRALDEWTGLRGYVQDHVAQNRRGPRRVPRPAACPCRRSIPQFPPAELRFDIYTYICGLNFMVSECARPAGRLRLAQKQIIFERYD
jgi:hypothetical protein